MKDDTIRLLPPEKVLPRALADYYIRNREFLKKTAS